MSLRKRARTVQRRTGLKYQAAMQILLEIGPKIRPLREKLGVTLEEADRYLVDRYIETHEIGPNAWQEED